MSPSNTITVPNGSATLVTLAELRDSPEWREMFHDQCKDHRFYELIEQTLGGRFAYFFLLLRDSEGRLRAIQPLFFVRQNLTEGMTGPVRAAVEQVQRVFPRFLTMKTLMVGCAAGEGHLGTCRAEDEEWVAAALHACLKTFARRQRTPLVVLKDFPSQYRDLLRSFSSNGYTRVASMPMTRLSLHHRGFEEYLNSLGTATRKNLRRQFRAT